jgi:hypothetical protein
VNSVFEWNGIVVIKLSEPSAAQAVPEAWLCTVLDGEICAQK